MFDRLDIDVDAVCWAVFGTIAILALLAGIGWMVWADLTQQCFGPAFNAHLDTCVNGHAVAGGAIGS